MQTYPGADGRRMETDSREESSASTTTAGKKLLGVFIISTNTKDLYVATHILS